MPNDTDLDALIDRHKYAAIEVQRATLGSFAHQEALAELNAAEAALRARLAPTRHADDEALVEMHDHAIRYNGGAPRIWEAACALRARLAELRARAETAERARAECRDKTIEECAVALEPNWSRAADIIRALKTKEPT